jgi:putative hemolysin
METNPDLPLLLDLLAIVLGLAVTALAAAADTALDEANRVRLRALAEREGRRKAAVQRLIEDPWRAWLTVLGLNLVGLVLATAGCVGLIQAWGIGAGPAVLVGAGFLLAALCLGQLAPRGWATRRPESAALTVAWPIDRAAWICAPLLGLAARAFGVQPLGQIRSARDDELRALLHADEENGPMEVGEMQMITGVMEFGDTQVHELMVPRIDIVAIPVSASLDEALDTIIRAGHSRIPVYSETIDEVVGLLYAKDLLRALRNRVFDADIASFLRQPHFVPESMPVDVLLADLRSRQVHMAIVVDEYGGTAGLVTIEDLLEEIVGEIQDEYDAEEPRMVPLGPGEAIVDAGLNLYDVNRLLDIHLPTDDVNTLAGLVFARLGRVPTPGEVIIFDDAEIEVLVVESRRVHRVRILRRGGEASEAGPGGKDAAPASPGAQPA